MALKKSQRSLKDWTKQKWRTKSGKPSAKTGERYLPSAAIKALSPQEYAATTRKNVKTRQQVSNIVSNPRKLQRKLEVIAVEPQEGLENDAIWR